MVPPNGRHHTSTAILGDLRGQARNDRRPRTQSSSSDLQSINATSSHIGNTDIVADKVKLGSTPRKQKGKLSLSIPHIIRNSQARERKPSFPSSTDLSEGVPKHGFRIIGRGGLGSSHVVLPPRPKTRKSEPCLAQARGAQFSPIARPSRFPPLPVNTAPSAPPPQAKIRYSGRGAGSKPRSVFSKLHIEHNFGFGFKISAPWKGKTMLEEEEKEIDSNAFIGDSESDVSSIHFAAPVVSLPKPVSLPRPPGDDMFTEAVDEERRSLPEVEDVEKLDAPPPSPIPSSGLEMQQRKIAKHFGNDIRYPKAGIIFVPKNCESVMSGRIVMPSLPPILPASDNSSSMTHKRSPTRTRSLPDVMLNPESTGTLGTLEDPCPCEDGRFGGETTPVSSMIFSEPPSPTPSLLDPIQEVPSHVEPDEADFTLLSPRSDSPFMDSIAPVSLPTFERVMSESGNFVSMMEEKQGWMGRWNRRTIGEAISALREL